MHFVWLGPNPISQRDQRNVEAFCRLHPHWDVQVWGNSDVAALPITGRLCQVVKPFAVACDIARVEIVHQHGGRYSDTDIHWLKPIGNLAASPMVVSARCEEISSWA